MLKHAAGPWIAGAVLALVIAGALLAVDAFAPPALPRGFVSPRQLVGVDVLLVLLPSYLIVGWGVSERRARWLLDRLNGLLPEADRQQRLPTPRTALLAGGIVGVLYAVAFNLPISSLQDLRRGGSLLVVLVTCMILVWLVVGVVLASRIHVAGLFLRVGRRVPVDLYDQTPLEPFARAGMGDMLLVVLALVLSTVQSIDATFRYQNYLYAMLVGVPAALLLLLRPMLSVHSRLRAAKRAELAEVNRLIRAAPKALHPGVMAELEVLLKRRDRVQELYTWPTNVAMVSRVVLYGVIPPAAWVAAALVEHFIENVIGR